MLRMSESEIVPRIRNVSRSLRAFRGQFPGRGIAGRKHGRRGETARGWVSGLLLAVQRLASFQLHQELNAPTRPIALSTVPACGTNATAGFQYRRPPALGVDD